MDALGRQLVRILTVTGVWLLLSCTSALGLDGDIACLRSVRDSLMDPRGNFNSWNFDNITEGSICAFMGVECWHPNENRVLNLQLSDMGLRGRFPAGLKNCTSLTGVDLSRNELYGHLPSDISKIIPYATTLNLSTNNFSGEIPADLSNCSYMNSLRLDRNRFTGRIPAALGLLTRLRDFSVADNLLTGPIPDHLSAANGTRFGAGSFANNPGLCGKPLDPCNL